MTTIKDAWAQTDKLKSTGVAHTDKLIRERLRLRRLADFGRVMGLDRAILARLLKADMHGEEQ